MAMFDCQRHSTVLDSLTFSLLTSRKRHFTYKFGGFVCSPSIQKWSAASLSTLIAVMGPLQRPSQNGKVLGFT